MRYFEHGVALLNPTGGLIEAAEMPVLDGEFRRIDGTQRGYGNYTVNNGAMWVGPTKPEDALPPYDGLLLIRDEINNNVQELELTVTQDSQSGSYYHRSIYGDPPPGCAENRWCNFRHEGATLIGVDWENTSISNGVLKFTIPSEAQLTSTSHIEESRLSLYVDSNINSNPRLWIDTNIENRPLVRWYSNYGEGWATSPNLRNLISGGTDTLTFYLQSDFVESPFSFRALEYGSGEFASVLTIHYHNSGGSGEINDPTVVFQHGVDGYAGGEDTHIVTSGWESPTPHDTFPVIYLRTSRDEDEVKSSLVRFDGISLPTNAQITNAVVAFYYNGQSVNGGAINVHLSGPYPDWLAPQTTWTNFQNNQNWQVDGVKGIDDRQVYLSERVVDYTEVGSWLYFNVTNLAQQGVYEYVLHASSLGVNKDIKIPSNEYWNPALRPKLMIWCTLCV